MNLNIDCIRDILISYDALNNSQKESITQKDLHLDAYTDNEVTFHLKQMDLSNCANLKFSDSLSYNPDETLIHALTTYGEDLLAAMRDEHTFEEFKDIIDSKYPSYNLEIFIYAYHSFLSTRYGM